VVPVDDVDDVIVGDDMMFLLFLVFSVGDRQEREEQRRITNE